MWLSNREQAGKIEDGIKARCTKLRLSSDCNNQSKHELVNFFSEKHQVINS